MFYNVELKINYPIVSKKNKKGKTTKVFTDVVGSINYDICAKNKIEAKQKAIDKFNEYYLENDDKTVFWNTTRYYENEFERLFYFDYNRIYKINQAFQISGFIIKELTAQETFEKFTLEEILSNLKIEN